MNRTFQQELNRLWLQKGYPSLRVFYQSQRFSFSYEYLRQVFHENKIPAAKKISEFAKALEADDHRLQQLAAEARLARKLSQHYRMPLPADALKISENIKRYRQEGLLEAKIMKMVGQLDKEEKDRLVEYLKFLKQQCRKKRK